VVSTCRRLAGIVPINLPHQFLLHQSSLPPVPRSSRPIGRGASGRSGCSSTRPRSNGGGERRGVRLRMCGGRRRRRERVIRGVDDRLTGGRVVTKFFHLPALLSSRRVGDDGHLSSIACRLASTPEGRKIRVLVMLAGGRWGSCPTVPHGELRHWSGNSTILVPTFLSKVDVMMEPNASTQSEYQMCIVLLLIAMRTTLLHLFGIE